MATEHVSKLLGNDFQSCTVTDVELAPQEEQTIELADRNIILVIHSETGRKFGLFKGILEKPEFVDTTPLYVSKNGKYLTDTTTREKLVPTW